MPETVFKKAQYAKETTKGTIAAATMRWYGKVSVPADRKPIFPEDANGRRARTHRTVINQIFADGITLSDDAMPFQKLPMVFSIGLKGGVTPTTGTTGLTDYNWDFTPNLSTTNAPDAITLQYGDDQQAFVTEYVMAKRITVSGRVGESENVKVSIECFGKQKAKQAFTASINPVALETMVANLTNFYVDANWAALGSTAKTGLLREWSVEILTGIQAKWNAEGVKVMTGHSEGMIDSMWTLTFEGTSEAVTLFDAFNADPQTPKALRIKVIGSTIGSTGGQHSLTLDGYGVFEEVIPLGAEGMGNNLYTAVFHCIDDNSATTSHIVAAKVVTNVNAI
jgi:hypothetical protein